MLKILKIISIIVGYYGQIDRLTSKKYNWMKIYIRIITILLLTIYSININAQEPTFTQFYANPIYLNPAFAGSNKCPRINMNYRNEWPNLSGNYVTYSASYDKFVKSIAGGLGVIATYDQQGRGTINTAMLGLAYSYHQKINRKFSMLFGARAAYFQKSIDPTKLTFNDMIDRYKGFIYPTADKIGDNQVNVQFFNASAGVLGYSKRFLQELQYTTSICLTNHSLKTEFRLKK